MPCPHNEITIVQRSQRQSAVAAAAYQSGEKLFCEYDQQVKHYPEKRGIVHNEILLPANAPRSYADRNTLWNAAEAVEKQWNSQLARRWVLTIPREIPPDQYAVLVREFCEQQFVSKGMIADFAIRCASSWSSPGQPARSRRRRRHATWPTPGTQATSRRPGMTCTPAAGGCWRRYRAGSSSCQSASRRRYDGPLRPRVRKSPSCCPKSWIVKTIPALVPPVLGSLDRKTVSRSFRVAVPR